MLNCPYLRLRLLKTEYILTYIHTFCCNVFYKINEILRNSSMETFSERLLYKRNGKLCFLVSIKLYSDTCDSLGELEATVETPAARVFTAFFVLPNFYSGYYNSSLA